MRMRRLIRGGETGAYQRGDEVAYQVGRVVLSGENEKYSIIMGDRIGVNYQGELIVEYLLPCPPCKDGDSRRIFPLLPTL